MRIIRFTLLSFINSFFLFAVISLLFSANLFTQDMSLPVEKRVNDLLKRMTMEEKIDLVSGARQGKAPTNTSAAQNSSTPNAILVASNFFSKTKKIPFCKNLVGYSI